MQYVRCLACGVVSHRVRALSAPWANTGGLLAPIGIRVKLECGHEQEIDGGWWHLKELGAVT